MQGCATLTECPFYMTCKGRLKVSCRLAPLAAAACSNQQFSLQVSIFLQYISNAISRGFIQCRVNRTTHNRSKVRVPPALCTLGPRLPLPHQVGAYIGGGGLQHVRHNLTWMAAQQGNYLFPYWATA